MEKFNSYIDIQNYIKQSKRRWKFSDIKKILNDNSNILEQFKNDTYTLDDILFAIKRFITLEHHYCPVCGNEIHVYNISRYPKTCSVSCGNKYSQELRVKLSLERYGTERPCQTQQVKDKVKNTMLERYGGYTYQSKELVEKVKKTNLERYGYEVSASNKDIHKKNIETCLKKYGVTHTSKLPENRQKMRETNKKLHGSENWNNHEKIVATCLKKYGVSNPTQCHDIRIKEQKKYLYNNINFDSSWELAFYIWHVDHNIDFEYQPNISFKYAYNGKIHTYHPDFRINGKIYEIQGDQYFNADKTKMICPYNHALDDKFNEKYKCMKNNNVIIITSNDIKKYLVYIYEKYDIMYLQQFKRK